MPTSELVKLIIGTALLLGLVALYVLVPPFVWRRTKTDTPEHAATIRAACIALLFVPGLVPGVHGAFPLPAWMVVLGLVIAPFSDAGASDLSPRSLLFALLFPVLGFFALRALFLRRLRAKDD